MLSRSLAALTFVASAVALQINGPSANAYWVQNVSNTITWTHDSNDANPIDIIITNKNETMLNGAFSIERNVDLSNGTFTVSNVTLLSGSGYTVHFVNGTNPSQIYGSSAEFEVRPPGTPVSSDEAAQPSNGAPASSSGGASSPAGAAPTSEAPSGNRAQQVKASVLAAAGLIAVSGLAALF